MTYFSHTLIWKPPTTPLHVDIRRKKKKKQMDGEHESKFLGKRQEHDRIAELEKELDATRRELREQREAKNRYCGIMLRVKFLDLDSCVICREMWSNGEINCERCESCICQSCESSVKRKSKCGGCEDDCETVGKCFECEAMLCEECYDHMSCEVPLQRRATEEELDSEEFLIKYFEETKRFHLHFGVSAECKATKYLAEFCSERIKKKMKKGGHECVSEYLSLFAARQNEKK